MRVRSVGILGAGAMGAALAELFAFNEIPVLLRDVTPEIVERGLGRVRTLVDELVRFHAERADREIGRIEALGVALTDGQRERIRRALAPKFSPERGEALVARVRGTTSVEELREVDLVVEAVFEKMEVKRPVLEEVDRIVPEHAVLASNTSSLSITRLAHGLSHVRQVLGVHFFNPPSTLPLVEVAAGLETRPDVVDEVVDLLGGMRNHRYPLLPIRVRESPAFIVNRLLIPVLNEACFALEEGLAPARDIDQAMKAGAGMPMGPFELADLVGIDVALEVAETMFREFGDPKYRPARTLRRMVDAGRLGRKTGAGFYEYLETGSAPNA